MDLILQLEDIHKRFGALEVIRGVSLDIRNGERHAIIGPNGAGKTTLTNLITSRFTPTSGTMRFKGEDVTGMLPFKLVRKGIGRSFQIINVFKDMTVLENLRNAVIARHRYRSSPWRRIDSLSAVRSESEAILKQIDLQAAGDRLALELPYGEQRMLEIGLVIAADPELVLLDEPAAGLSAAETRDVTALIRKVTEGKSLLLIEHDMDVVFSLATRISVLHYGQILTQGTPDEIRNDPRVKEVYLGKNHAA
jgi:branched-chain amino acid transport system ATP-binding protein